MNFTEVVNEVVSTVKRPDKLIEARRAVHAAINFCCIEADFARDLEENSYPISSSEYVVNIPVSDFTRFRKIQYIRPTNRLTYIDPLSADKIFKRGSECDAKDKYYIAGDSLILQLSTLAEALLIGHYKFPPILTDASPTFWLLEVSPFMIIDKAASIIFSGIGDEKSADYHTTLFRPAFVSAMADYKYGFKP